MKYFNGFSLLGEEVLFKDYLLESDYAVAGFSYGSQKAFEYVYASSHRIDRLILLSPAFFQDQKSSFKRRELRYFDRGEDAYIKQFLMNVSSPFLSNVVDKYLDIGKKYQLEDLLDYRWDKEKIKEVIARGTSIEIFVGVEDKIVNIDEVLAFFEDTECVCYKLKDAGHLLYT
ncbi:hypothetical protein MNB_SV-13-164 [hydrothermal vent metagenome]|uniref:AB hydrolase-1 domain-containing protein n=1 Tax=hydrothermal vent metagenome TaxID=652676 RepID=A0A1W1CG49_9ZZZZ